MVVHQETDYYLALAQRLVRKSLDHEHPGIEFHDEEEKQYTHLSSNLLWGASETHQVTIFLMHEGRLLREKKITTEQFALLLKAVDYRRELCRNMATLIPTGGSKSTADLINGVAATTGKPAVVEEHLGRAMWLAHHRRVSVNRYPNGHPTLASLYSLAIRLEREQAPLH